ncbi:MAG: flagellar protein [Spirochaetaceae bacterium]|nr:MAG: flagellar protein [Spirochaetaceae bacterium]
MRRLFILVVSLLAVVSFAAVAEQAVLIDFSELIADWPPDNPNNNEATIFDYSEQAGTGFSEEERLMMRSSLAIENWEVLLAPSSRYVRLQAESFARQAFVREGANRYAGEGVMGVRVNFPMGRFNSWALIRPPFEIPAYEDVSVIEDDGTITTPQDEEGRGRKFDGYGVVKNVGTLRSLSMNVHGLNFPHGISVVLQDENFREQEIFLGYLDFDGWRTLEWRNPNYITDVRMRDLRPAPLYPNLAPMRKLIGIRIYRDAEVTGGDFISYIKDINVTYDRAVLELERDIDDEAVWGILQQREAARRRAELERVGNVQILRFLEQQRMFDEDNGDI